MQNLSFLVCCNVTYVGCMIFMCGIVDTRVAPCRCTQFSQPVGHVRSDPPEIDCMIIHMQCLQYKS